MLSEPWVQTARWGKGFAQHRGQAPWCLAQGSRRSEANNREQQGWLLHEGRGTGRWGWSRAGRGFISKSTAPLYLDKIGKAGLVAVIRLNKSPDYQTSPQSWGKSTATTGCLSQWSVWPGTSTATVKVRQQQRTGSELKHSYQSKGEQTHQDRSQPFPTLLSQQLDSRPGGCTRLALTRGRGYTQRPDKNLGNDIETSAVFIYLSSLGNIFVLFISIISKFLLWCNLTF